MSRLRLKKKTKNNMTNEALTSVETSIFTAYCECRWDVHPDCRHQFPLFESEWDRFQLSPSTYNSHIRQVCWKFLSSCNISDVDFHWQHRRHRRRSSRCPCCKEHLFCICAHSKELFCLDIPKRSHSLRYLLITDSGDCLYQH